ncbi:MAG: NAD-dependent epimerase/dehydratase family protein [Flavobacteriales bacterium]|nr:NAD-dependent epimerase/dehydratase family protein [Flavobacteriales bacterium]
MRLPITGGSGFIGTNLIRFYEEKQVPILNLDWNPPLCPDPLPYWKEADILNGEACGQLIREFAPTHVVHLAARTDTDEATDVEAYRQNHEGTRLLLEQLKACPSIQRVIVTSTQFVCEAGYQPKDASGLQALHRVWGIEAAHRTDHTRSRFGMLLDHHSANHHLGAMVTALSGCDVQGHAQGPLFPPRPQEGHPFLWICGQCGLAIDASSP